MRPLAALAIGLILHSLASAQTCVGGVCRLLPARANSVAHAPHTAIDWGNSTAPATQPVAFLYTGAVGLPVCCGSSEPAVPTIHAQPCCVHRCVACAPTSRTAPQFAPGRGSLFAQAMASAQHRATNGIRGRSHLDSGSGLLAVGASASGVGWSSHDSQPMTCLGRGGENYVSVRGRDGWYATKIQRYLR